MLERKVKGMIITASTLVVALLLALSFGLIDMAWADTAPGNEPEMGEQASVGMVKLMALDPVAEAGDELVLFESEAEEEPVVLPSEDGLFVKIGLYYGSTAVSGITLTSEEGFLLAENVDRSWAGREDLSAYKTLDVRAENGGAAVYDAEGNLLIESLGNEDVLMALGDFDERVVNIGTKACRDGAMFVNIDGRLNVINYVSMEHYIMGV
ncbi:MAG: hypothetical protein II689_02005, partial [Firmicutes bacterium]|nr:hypothetical protein [Bacillota bacterium]